MTALRNLRYWQERGMRYLICEIWYEHGNGFPLRCPLQPAVVDQIKRQRVNEGGKTTVIPVPKTPSNAFPIRHQ